MPSVTRIVKADASTIWRWLTVPELMRQWMPGITDLRSEDGAPIDEGSRLLFTARGQQRSTTVTEFEPERALTLRSLQGSFAADYRYLVDSSINHCKVTLDIHCGATGVARLMAPLVRVAAWLTDKSQMEHLAAVIEADQSRIRG